VIDDLDSAWDDPINDEPQTPPEGYVEDVGECPSCKKPVTEDMDSCPYCGDILFHYLRSGMFVAKRGAFFKAVTAFIIVFLVVLAALGLIVVLIRS